MNKQELIDLLSDPYFKDMELDVIFELAKKSIRLTDENIRLRRGIEDMINELKKDGYHWIGYDWIGYSLQNILTPSEF